MRPRLNETRTEETTMSAQNQIDLVRSNLSRNALTNLEQVARTIEDQDAMIGSDLDVGSIHPDKLLATCLNGAEGEDVIAGWTEYVGAIVKIARGHYQQS
jgi:hypothetical protein